jgi:Holliday junction resolvasome RuvABC DNA-binding subunit
MVKTISYLVLTLHELGYSLDEIQKIRKGMECQFNHYTPEEAERQAIHILGELLLKGRTQTEQPDMASAQ